jgi:serine/threonine protein kinase
VIGEQFGSYRLDELIGQGGMGEVYRAYDTTRKRTVALKRLSAQQAGDREFQARFQREAEVAARLTEPHIIPIHDYGEIAGQLFIDMRLIVGKDLAALIRDTGPLPPARAVAIVTQVASALAAAHAEGLIHRDVKPSNVLISATDRGEDYVHLVDFGIARFDGATSLTATGSAVGTVDYMAPERLLHGQCDHRVDVYALGCVLYEALTGTKPFPYAGLAAQMYAHVHTRPPSLAQQQPDLPSGLEQVITRAMAKDPEERHRSTTELATAAQQALTRGSAASDPAQTTISAWPLAYTTPVQTPGYTAPMQTSGPPPPWPPAPPSTASASWPAAPAQIPRPAGPGGHPPGPAYERTLPDNGPGSQPPAPGPSAPAQQRRSARKLVTVIAVAVVVLVAVTAFVVNQHSTANPDASPTAAAPNSAPVIPDPAAASSTPNPGADPTPAQASEVTAIFELTGTGTADAIALDPADYLNYKPLPFRKTVSVPADIDLLQIHASGTHASNVGCRITLDGKVVVDHPNDGDCVYTKPAGQN